MSRFSAFAPLFAITLLAGCAGIGPSVEERHAVNTPIFADNRVYHLGPAAGDGSALPRQPLVSLGEAAQPGDTDVVKANDPLSIIIRSVELPAVEKGGPITGTAHYAVILDLATAADGSSQSMVVWYQRDVQPNQSLNFSNLLVYYEPRWDERVAPLFRLRVLDVTKESNEQTLQALKQAQQVANVVGTFAATPLASPLINVAFSAASMVLGNEQNRAVLDYTVQLYSSSAQAKAGSGRLGALKAGSYVVVGKPNSLGREFWRQGFAFEPESRLLESGGKTVNVPTALITVGTFESIVPKLVLERSAALTTLLAAPPSKTSIEQVDDSILRLQASVQTYVYAEKLKRYKNATTIAEFNRFYSDTANKARIGDEDLFNFLRAASDCLKPATPFGSMDDLKKYISEAPLKCG